MVLVFCAAPAPKISVSPATGAAPPAQLAGVVQLASAPKPANCFSFG